MSFKNVDLNRLKATLMTTGLATRDQPTFQVLDGLIGSEQNLKERVEALESGSSGDTTIINNAGPSEQRVLMMISLRG